MEKSTGGSRAYGRRRVVGAGLALVVVIASTVVGLVAGAPPASAACVNATYDCAVQNDAPLLYWKLDETINTLVSSGSVPATGALQTNASLGRPGLVGAGRGGLDGGTSLQLAGGNTGQTSVGLGFPAGARTSAFTIELLLSSDDPFFRTQDGDPRQGWSISAPGWSVSDQCNHYDLTAACDHSALRRRSSRLRAPQLPVPFFSAARTAPGADNIMLPSPAMARV